MCNRHFQERSWNVPDSTTTPVTQIIISLQPLGVESWEKLWDNALTKLRRLAPSEAINSHSHFRNEVLGQTQEHKCVK